jgi:signal transduction histidine kinase
MIPRDLRGRVTLASVGVLAGGLLALSVLINVLLARSLDADAAKVLRERAAAQRAALDVDRHGVRTDEHADDAVLDELSWVFSPTAELERPRVAAPVEAAAVRLAGRGGSGFADVRDQIRLFVAPIRVEGRRVGAVVVGVRLEPYVHTERLALLATGALDVFVLLIGALMARRAVTAALRPVAEMAARAEDWSEHDLHRRFDLGAPRDEITGLAATLDGMLARIDAALRREQRFSAEMAHELRTPLSGVRAETELMLRRRDLAPELALGLEQILASTDRMAGVIETLLASERAGASEAHTACDAAVPVREVVRAMRPAAEAHGIRVRTHGADVPQRVLADPDMLAQAFQPLLDNAIRHARDAVDVRLHADGADLVVAVDDDGAGIDGADPEALFAPGHSTTGGAGLGLPLARRLARSLGGDVLALPAAAGRFELRLPRA